MKRDRVTFQFVEFIPTDQELEDGVVYVSTTYATAVHKCCSGCGNKVVTPISPTDWTLIFDGDTVSLDPSIGNWSLPCKSHYWITRNRVEWAAQWTRKQIEAGRAEDRRAKDAYFKAETATTTQTEPAKAEANFWQRFKKRFARD